MATKINKNPKPADKWMREMKQKFPIITDQFERMLNHWKFENIGHAFGQLALSENCLNIFLNANDVFLNQKDMRNIELLKSSLEQAFKNSEQLSESLVRI